MSIDRGARCAAHLFDRLVQRTAENQLAIEMGDIVASLNSGAIGRCILERCDYLHRAVFERHGKAETAIFALALHRQPFEPDFVEKGAVRIEAREHAVDRPAHQVFVADFLDIFGAHALEHVHELVEFAIGIDIHGRERGSKSGDQSQCTGSADRTDKGFCHGLNSLNCWQHDSGFRATRKG